MLESVLNFYKKGKNIIFQTRIQNIKVYLRRIPDVKREPSQNERKEI